MVRHLLALLLTALLALGAASPAAAQNCPDAAFTDGPIPEGSRVRVVALSEGDAYHPDRGSIVGQVGRVDRLTPSGTSAASCWYSGQFYPDDGESKYFYQVAVEVLGTGASRGSCPSGAHTGAPLDEGTRVRLLTVSPEDAYHDTRHEIAGETGELVAEWSKTAEPCWYAGQFRADDGTTRDFYQVAVQPVDAGDAAAQGCPAEAVRTGLPEGQRVEVLALHADDAYHSDAASIVGKQGTVTGDLHPNDGCWVGGGFTADDGTYYYFYKAAVQDLGSAAEAVSSCPDGAWKGATPSDGARVEILTVSSQDAYYQDRQSIAGAEGRVSGSWSKTGGQCWFAGQFYADDGSDYYFYQAAVRMVAEAKPEPTAGAQGCPPGASTASLSEGTRVKVIGVHPEDAYHDRAAEIIGTQGTVTGDLQPNDGCWMGGGVTADDGSYYYFFKASVKVLDAEQAPGAGGPGDRFMGSAVGNGQRVRIVALHPDDAYYAKRDKMVGKTCTATERMTAQSRGWYSGPVRCTDGEEHYFFKVGVVLE